jgi:hypothetical protein
MRRLLSVFAASTFAAPAHAYIGPGSGLGAIIAAIVFLLAVVLLLFGFVWYPLKRFLRCRNNSGNVRDQTTMNE